MQRFQYRRCLLIDKAGYVVWSAALDSPAVHITLAEPEISNSLVNARVMSVEQCATIEDAKRHRTYKV